MAAVENYCGNEAKPSGEVETQQSALYLNLKTEMMQLERQKEIHNKGGTQLETIQRLHFASTYFQRPSCLKILVRHLTC